MAFDVEYTRWLEEQNRQINELRTAVNSHASDAELRIIVDGVMAHYDEIFRLKSNAAKADVFHLLSGMWKTPAERCFLWLGGFRSSELLKVIHPNLPQLIRMLKLLKKVAVPFPRGMTEEYSKESHPRFSHLDLENNSARTSGYLDINVYTCSFL